MSAAPGTEVLDVGPSRVDPDALSVRHSRPVRPSPPPSVRVAARPVQQAGPGGAAAWAQALHLRSLPVVLLGPVVVLVLLLAEPTAGRVAALPALTGFVLLHLLTALLRGLGDPRRHRAGRLRRVQAGRAVLGLAVVGAALAGSLVAAIGWPALLPVLLGVLAVGVAVRPATSLAVPVGSASAAVALWFLATGTLPWRVVLAAAVAGVLVAAVRAPAPARALLAAPCAAVGLAVALQALPWPALLVAASLPVARRAAVTGRPAAGPARLTALLLLAGLALALVSGTDLPLTAPR